MEEHDLMRRLASAGRVLVGLGEEWKLGPDADEARQEQVLAAYDALYGLLKEKDYFIITMAVDARIYGTRLGSRQERVVQEEEPEEVFSCSADEKTLELMDRIFPPKKRIADTRDRRIVAPCGNENGPQWDHYIQWLAKSWSQELLILELGVGFSDPGVIRFPFEKTALFNQKAYLMRVHKSFPQLPGELKDRAEGIQEPSVDFVLQQGGASRI